MRPQTSRLAAATALLLAVVTAVVFAPGLRGGFLYDDYYLVETNPTLRQPGSLAHYLSTPLFAGVEEASEHWAVGRTQYWRPCLKLAYLVQYRLFGTAPRGWHVVSLILHIACVLLACAWLYRRVGRDDPDAHRSALVIAAALAAALFALHPSRCEAVAWVSGSADVWMTFWILIGAWAWDRGGAGATVGAVVAFTLAVLCKETALVVPVCLAADAWLLAPRRAVQGGPTAVRWRFPALLALLAIVIVARWMLLPRAPGAAFIAGGSPLRPVASLGLYVARVLWPLHPSTQIGLMDANERFALAPWSIALGLVVSLGFVMLLGAATRRHALGPWLADALWFFLPLAPVANFVSLGYSTLIAERFLYLPFLGVASLATRSLVIWLRRAKSPLPAVLAVMALCGAYATICWRYLPVLRSNATLWAYEVRLAPENPLLRLYQSQAEWQAGRLEAAMAAARASYERARRDDARAEAALSWASIRFQIAAGREAALLAGLRDFFDTLVTGPGAAQLEADGLRFEARPTDGLRVDLARRTSLRLARAVAHARTGDPVFAEHLLRDLLRDDPSPAAAANLVRVLAHQKRWDEASQVLAEAQVRNSNDPTLAELRAPIAAGRSLARAGETAGERAGLQRARVWIALGAPALARRELAALGEEHAWDADVVLCAAMADAADGDLDAARRRIEAARARHPEASSTWDAALAQVQALASGTPASPAAKSTSLDALFR